MYFGYKGSSVRGDVQVEEDSVESFLLQLFLISSCLFLALVLIKYMGK